MKVKAETAARVLEETPHLDPKYRWVYDDRFDLEPATAPANQAALAGCHTQFEWNNTGTGADGTITLEEKGLHITVGSNHADNIASLAPIDVANFVPGLGVPEFFEYDDEIDVSWTILTDTAYTAELDLLVGLQSTATALGVADTTTMADQAAFWWSNSATYIACITSVTGTDASTTTEVPLAVSTEYILRIKIGTDYKPRFYINEELVATGAALANITSHGFKPVIAMARTGTTTDTGIWVRGLRISKIW